jgi:hypothetical protein
VEVTVEIMGKVNPIPVGVEAVDQYILIHITKNI